MVTLVITMMGFSDFSYAFNDEETNIEKPTHDPQGRKYIQGPVYGGYHYDNVHIISNSVGLHARGTVHITNSVIDAPVCVSSNGIGLNASNNKMNCNLCFEFKGAILMDNRLINNSCSGRGTNRSDAFGF